MKVWPWRPRDVLNFSPLWILVWRAHKTSENFTHFFERKFHWMGTCSKVVWRFTNTSAHDSDFALLSLCVVVYHFNCVVWSKNLSDVFIYVTPLYSLALQHGDVVSVRLDVCWHGMAWWQRLRRFQLFREQKLSWKFSAELFSRQSLSGVV